MLYLLPAFAWPRSLVRGISLLSVLIPLLAFSTGSVTLEWNPSVSQNVAGYNIYYGTISHDYTNKISVGNATSVTITNLVEGDTYYFAATAYDVVGSESSFSDEAAYTVPLNPANHPATLTSQASSNGWLSFTLSGVAGTPYVIEASTNLINWEPVFTNVAPFTFTIPISSQYNQRFFRAYYSPALNPEVSPPTLTSVRQINGQFSFTVSGVAGYQYTVETSTNLIDWVPVTTNVSPFTFTATNMRQLPQQFYRAIYLP